MVEAVTFHYRVEPEVTVELIGLLLDHENGEERSVSCYECLGCGSMWRPVTVSCRDWESCSTDVAALMSALLCAFFDVSTTCAAN